MLRVRHAASLFVTLVLLAMWPVAAQARWFKAQTEHFNVYGEGFEDVVRDYANKLEAFDAILRERHGLKTKDFEAPIRLDVYLVRNRRGLTRVWPTAGEDVAGFYSASTSGIYMVAICNPEIGLNPTDVLFHEYTHHFMLQNYAYPYASWLVEGYAEYYMTAKITDKTIEIGHPSEARAQWLLGVGWIPYDQILSKRSGEITGGDDANYYPQAWLLTHYMLSDPARRRQLDDYMRRVGRGEPSIDAMTAATGMTPVKLSGALHAYALGSIKVIGYNLIKPLHYPVTVTTLPASADDVLLERLQVHRAHDDDDDTSQEKAEAVKHHAALLAYVRRIAAARPGDRLAELTQAEAEIRIGDRAAGEAILRRYVDADPKDAEALWLAGYSRILAAKNNTANRAALYAEARPYLSQAFKLDPDNYQVLYGYAQTRSLQPGYPDENTLNALELSHQLAPQVEEISIAVAVAMRAKGRTEEGDRLLTLVANDPHGGSAAKTARGLLGQSSVTSKPAVPIK
jgi:tetratricopeptide (TPR) repeat protein